MGWQKTELVDIHLKLSQQGLLIDFSEYKTGAVQVVLVVKNLPANAGHEGRGFLSGSGRFPAGGHSSPLQYSCLEDPMDRGAWRSAVHRVTESDVTEATKQRQHIYLLILFQIIFPYTL